MQSSNNPDTSRQDAKKNASVTHFLNQAANPGVLLRLMQPCLPFLWAVSGLFLGAGLIDGIFIAPIDWQQGSMVRLMYVHVPMAWLASALYLVLAVCGVCSLVWRHPLADLAAIEIGPVGASAAGLCLITGALWGKPTWGTWWVWDARLTSVLVLFFLYLGHISLIRAFDNPVRGQKAAAILALAGALDLPVIKFSVEWWNTLHQPASITLTHAPHMPLSMLVPLLLCTLGLTVGVAGMIGTRLCAAILEKRIRTLHFKTQARPSASPPPSPRQG